MTPPRFLLDEHVPHAVQSQLLPLAPPKGTLDPDILAWIEKTGYILVTANRHTIPEHVQAHYAAGHHIPGVLLLRPGARLGQIIEQLYLLWAASNAKEYADKFLYLPML